MEHVGSYEAKTHLPRLLERVKKGERITITKHGVPVAVLQPADASECADRRRLSRIFVRFGKNTCLTGCLCVT